MYRSYQKVLEKYGELSPYLASYFLVKEANIPIGYKLPSAMKIILRIKKDKEYKKKIDYIIEKEILWREKSTTNRCSKRTDDRKRINPQSTYTPFLHERCGLMRELASCYFRFRLE